MPSAQLPVLEQPDVVACCSPLAASEINDAQAEVLARQFAALADAVRLRIISLLATAEGGTVCACDLVEPTGKSQPTVSHHLKQLRDAGLVEGTRKGTNTFYRPRLEALGALCRVIDPACC